MSTLWNSRCGLFIGMARLSSILASVRGPGPAAHPSVSLHAALRPGHKSFSSSQDRQAAHRIGVRDLAPLDRILELEGKMPGRPHAALGRKRAAEHQRVLGEAAVLSVA